MAPSLPGTPEPADSPESSPSTVTAESSSPYGQDNRDLPKQIVEAFRSTILEFQGQEKYARLREVRRARKLRHYEAGNQFLQWSDSRGFTDLTLTGSAYNNNGESMQCPTYMDVYNIFLRFFLIIQAVLTQTLPPVRWQPIDPSSPDDVDKSTEAQKYSKMFDRFNDIKDLLAQIVRMFGMDGRTVAWTRTEEDSQKFGLEDDGTAKRFQRTTIHGVLETKVPITCR